MTLCRCQDGVTRAGVPMSDQILIEVGDLAARIAARGELVLADVRWTLNGPSGRPDYERAHLPGAQWVDLDRDLSSAPGEGGRHPLPDPEGFAAAMRRIGVSAADEVIAYDAADSLAAARLWWLLSDAGHSRVRVLNGGFAAWRAADGAVESGPGADVAPGDFRGRPGHRSRVDAVTIADRIRRGAAPVLVDVRAAERYAGSSEPIDPVAGHIPGAVSRPSMDLLDPTGRFVGPATIQAAYDGLDAPVLYCGSGITAAHSLLALESAGRTDAAIYPGSWSDWIRDPAHPVGTGGSRED